jgi:hypothetical protein
LRCRHGLQGGGCATGQNTIGAVFRVSGTENFTPDAPPASGIGKARFPFGPNDAVPDQTGEVESPVRFAGAAPRRSVFDLFLRVQNQSQGVKNAAAGIDAAHFYALAVEYQVYDSHSRRVFPQAIPASESEGGSLGCLFRLRARQQLLGCI